MPCTGARPTRQAVSYTHLAAFLVQMEGIRRFRPNTAAQPDFARALREAREAGVEIVCCGCRVTPDSVEPAYLIPVEL